MKEVGVYLRISTQTVKRLIDDGRLPAHRIGRCSYRIPQDAVKTLLLETLATGPNESFANDLDPRMTGTSR